MYQRLFPTDPIDLSGAVEWLTEAVERLTNYTVTRDETLGGRLIEISSRARTIRINPPEEFGEFHRLLGRATLFTVGGSSWAPEFTVRPRLYVVPDPRLPGGN